MKLNIGENIKRMRKERKITQEELAEKLGVSCQSVSRWENGICYPDVELIPVIADFFHISTDRLMGIDEAVERQAVKRYLNDFQKAISVGNIDECIRIARCGVAEFPNNYTLLNKLMYALFVSTSDDADIPDWKENMHKYDAEIVALGERIIKYCPDIEIRLEATARLAFQHCEMGRKQLGRSIYETMPTTAHCREMAIWPALDEEEKLPQARMVIERASNLLFAGIYSLSFNLPAEEAIKAFEKYDAIERVLYDGKPCEWSWHGIKHNYLIAKYYLQLNRIDEAIKHIRAAAEAAVAFDNRPEEIITTTFLLGEQVDRLIEYETADSRSCCEILRDAWLAETEFDVVRSTEEFKQIIRDYLT